MVVSRERIFDGRESTIEAPEVSVFPSSPGIDFSSGAHVTFESAVSGNRQVAG